jgi:acyl dehydratase
MNQAAITMNRAAVVLAKADDIRALKGQPGLHSPWIRIDQPMIDSFANATADRQWIHVDAERAARESPYGRTIAHGFLTLSLLSHLFTSCFSFRNRKMSMNYGFDRVRFTSAVEVGAEVRAAIALADFTDIGPQELRTMWDVRMEVARRTKPALIALWLIQMSY